MKKIRKWIMALVAEMLFISTSLTIYAGNPVMNGSSAANISFNGNDVVRIYLDSTLVWQKHIHSSGCYHAHSGNSTSGGGCYGTKKGGVNTLTCTKSATTTTHGSNQHCPTCLNQNGSTMYVYWTNHSSCGSGRSEAGGKHVCNTCGNTSYTWGASSGENGTHTYEQSYTYYELNCGKAAGQLICTQ